MNRRQFLQTSSALGLAAGLVTESQANDALPKAKVTDGDNFYKSDKVVEKTVRFHNLYGMQLTGSLFTPKTLANGAKAPALVISHPFAAVRQQAAVLYATKLAEAGFVTLAFDQTFWGESDGYPRGAVLPDMYVENFSAGVDYLGMLDNVDRNRIGALGVCASGAFAVAATKIDPRIRALAVVSMYDMGEYFRNGVAGDRPKSRRDADLKKAAQDRWTMYETGKPVYGPGQNDPVFVEMAESNDYYRTERGFYAPNDRRTVPAAYAKFANFYPFNDIESISPRPILFVAGDKAPSRCYTETAYSRAAQPKELVWVKGANRTDLYDRVGLIPWNRLGEFFTKNLT